MSVFSVSVGVHVYRPCDETSLDSVQDNGVNQSLHAGPDAFVYFIIHFNITIKDVPLKPGAVFVKIPTEASRNQNIDSRAQTKAKCNDPL